MRHRCPSLTQARAVGGVTAYDAMAVGGDGVVTAWPQPRGLITAAGWNGGGFKIAPAVGDRVADLIRKVIE
jgi:glycine/D-amino acid oxidase-like deaminating enzyme